MRYVYFTKTLRELDVAGLIDFCKDTGVEGFDFTVRPGYPVTPDNALTELPKAAKAFRDEGLFIGLVSTPTNLNDPDSPAAQKIFEAAGKAGVAAVKIGYFSYTGKFEAALVDARSEHGLFVERCEVGLPVHSARRAGGRQVRAGH